MSIRRIYICRSLCLWFDYEYFILIMWALCVKNTPALFSERNGYDKPFLKLGNFRFFWRANNGK